MKVKGLFVLFFSLSSFLFFSCTKINESTRLGDDLLPAVDNVNTFDTTLEVEAAYFPYDDTARHSGFDDLALGRIIDPEFGTTNADMYFNFSSPVYGSHAFSPRDSVKEIDSVVLSLAYQSAYGDTGRNNGTQLTVQVAEISPGTAFRDDSSYRYTVPGFPTAAVLANKTFTVQSIKDSFLVVRKGDTNKVANTLRIRMSNNSLGDKLLAFDSIQTSGKGGYFSDSAFRALFRGLAVKTTGATGVGALAYFNLTSANSRLIVYYKVGRGTGIDSGASVSFAPYRSGLSRNGHANSIVRTPAGNYAANLRRPTSEKLYLQSAPSGSYLGISIPQLAIMPNKVIHRAELIAYTVPSIADDKLTEPSILFLAHKGSNPDSTYVFDRDLLPTFDGSSLDFAAFGGILRTDDSYRFNITRYVQGVVTRKERSDSLILYAPYIARVYSGTTPQPIGILDYIARGRAVLANSNYPDRTKRLRLRIIYSNL